MAEQDLYSGLIRLHVLHHAAREDVFGLGMIRELRRHGYHIGPGTLYPLLHRMEERGYLRSRQMPVNGKLRRCYQATARGKRSLERAKAQVRELFEEIFEEPGPLNGGEGSKAAPRTDPTRAGTAGKNGRRH